MKSGIYFNFPSWANPHISKDWLRRERDALIARGEWDVWEREYGAKRVAGGSNAIFPMLAARHIKPHAEVMAEVLRDRKKLVWQVIADPGTSTVFGVLFRAINPYTKRVYRLAEIYEKDMRETSTSRILPRIAELRDELCPAWAAHGIEWEQIYDEAASWFAAEIMASFPREEPWTPTQKGTKDKLVGLSLMKDQLLFDLTVISDRCVNFAKEMRGYIRKPDGKIPKENDHLLDCLTGDSLVHTETGLVPIADVRAGDRVWTRGGLRAVTAQWEVGEREIVRLRFSTGRHLDCTGEHLVFTSNRGFVAARDLTHQDELLGDDRWPTSKSSSSTESSSAAIQTQSGGLTASISARTPDTTHSVSATCTLKSGNPSTAKSPRGTTSIIGMGTRSTTPSRISNACQSLSTYESITSASRLPPRSRTSTAFVRLRPSGIAVPMGALGIPNTAGPSLLDARSGNTAANSAAAGSSQRGPSLASAPMPARARGDATPVSTTSNGRAASAASPTSSIDTPETNTAPKLVAIEPAGTATVFDITVEGSHEFFAAGVLVHNCDRYGNDYAGCDLSPDVEPKARDPEDGPRFRTPEQDLDDDYEDDHDLDF